MRRAKSADKDLEMRFKGLKDIVPLDWCCRREAQLLKSQEAIARRPQTIRIVGNRKADHEQLPDDYVRVGEAGVTMLLFCTRKEAAAGPQVWRASEHSEQLPQG